MIESCLTQPQLFPAVKVCSTCGKEKPESEFIPKKGTCRKCKAAYGLAYRATPEYKARDAERRAKPERRAARKAWQKTHGPAATAKYDRSEKGKVRNAAYRALESTRKSERIRQSGEKYKLRRAVNAQTEKSRAARAAWGRSLKGKEFYANRKHRRRAKEKGAATATTDQIRALLKAAKTCRYCSVKFSRSVGKTLDHVIPFARDGHHSLDNLTVCCKSCNSRKNALPPEEWAARIGLLLI